MSRLPTSPTEQARADEARKAKLAEDTAREALDVQWLVAADPGRRLVRWLVDRSGVLRSSFDATAMVMAHNEGRRSLGIELLRLIQRHCPESTASILNDRIDARPIN